MSWEVYSRAMAALDALVDHPNIKTREALRVALLEPGLCEVSLVQMRDILVYRHLYVRYKKDKALISTSLKKIGFYERWEKRLSELRPNYRADMIEGTQ